MRGHLEHASGGRIEVNDLLLLIDRDDALDHGAQDREHLLTFLFGRRDPFAKVRAHVVDRLRESPDLVLGLDHHFLVVVSARDRFGGRGHRQKRPGQTPRVHVTDGEGEQDSGQTTQGDESTQTVDPRVSLRRGERCAHVADDLAVLLDRTREVHHLEAQGVAESDRAALAFEASRHHFGARQMIRHA